MPTSTSASTRKRSQAQLEEEDELSTQKPIPVPLSATPKRRKINSSSPSPGDGLFGTLKHKLSNLSNLFSKDKENRTSFDVVDELVDQKEEKDIYDVPDDSPDERRQSKGTPRGRKDPKNTRDVLAPATGKTPMFNRRKSKSNGNNGHVEDGEIHDKGTRSSQRRKSSKIGNADSSEIAKSPPHRLRMSAGFTKATKMKRAKAESRELARQNLQAGGSELNGEDDATTKKPNRRRSSWKNEESLPHSDSEQAVPSIIGIRSSRKNESHISESGHAPRGILTPSKGRVGRPRKSVAFEANQGEIDMGFKDLPKSASLRKSHTKKGEDIYAVPEDSPSCQTSRRSQTKQPAREDELEDTKESEQSSEEEDIACSICSKLNSRKGNQMLLCDECNLGYHQKCCGVLVIPEGEWFCEECKLDGLNINKTTNSLVEVKIPDIDGFEDHLRRIQRIVLDRLTGQKRVTLRGHDEQLLKVQQIVEQTVLAGEGNSMMVIGGRGCGKTTLVESVISDIAIEHRDSFHVVRLNGFIHTDDKIASREIWRQLGREMELDDDSNQKPSNHADTLASLLALLSHPSEIAETLAEQTAKSVIFIIDEFDLFTAHPRQTLLYNLFDIAQARKAPISVLGLTTHIDVVEALEKRVKSRFSHRTVYLSFPRSPPIFWEICKEALTLGDDDADKEGFLLSIPGGSDFLAYWNKMIDNLYAEDESFRSQVLSHYYRTKSVPAFLNSCIIPVASLSSKSFPLTGKSFAASASLLAPPDSKLQILQGLAEVELALLIAAARLDIIHDTDTCNFAMVYDEYSSLTSRHKIQTSSSGVTALGSSAKVWGRDVALEAWEKLADCGLLVHANIGGGGGQNVGTGGRMWKVDVGLEEIAGSIDGLSGVMAKWCREI